MDDCKNKYQKYKQMVKQWEDEFMKQNDRIPTKEDIKNASNDVRYAYKSYHNLKRELSTKENSGLTSTKDEILLSVQNSLTSLFSDETASPPDEKSKEASVVESNGKESKKKEILPVFNSSGKLSELTARMDAMKQQIKRTRSSGSVAEGSPNVVMNVDQVWGEHLKGSGGVRKFQERTASFQISEKLYSSATFKSKRNPLKPHTPLRRTKSAVFSDFLQSRLAKRSIDESSTTGTQQSEETSTANEEKQEDWDKTETPNLTQEEPMEIAASSQDSSVSLDIFSTKCKLKVKDTCNSANTSKGNGHSKFSSNIDEKWLDRCVKPRTTSQSSQGSYQSAAINSQSSVILHMDNCNIDSQNSLSSQMDIGGSDDDAIISNSDTEEPSKVSMVMKRKAPEENAAEVAYKKTKLSKKEVLEKKIADGKLNENFVKVNLKKRVFVRGKKNTNFSKYKKMMYKRKQMDNDGGGGAAKKGNCFTCGMAGHWATNCPQNGGLISAEEAALIDDSPYLTLEEADALASENRPIPRFSLEPTEEVLKPIIEPLYKLDNGKIPKTPKEVKKALKDFGYDSFRPGQEETIMRILCGQSSLVMLSTGAGKSLCYQLPAYLYNQKKGPCIALVVSPLVSLMDDQVNNMPGPLNGACLHTNMTPKQKVQVEQQLKDGELHVLLVSPEAIINSDRQGLGGLLSLLPPVSFACVDEAHCVSQWSHNFRPSYLMLCKVLREKLKIRTLLGLTATATKSTAESIAKNLGVADGRIIADLPMPSNLVLSVSRDVHRDAALLELLKGERFSACDSIIIYCIRREECDRIAATLRTCLQDSKKHESNKRGAISWNAEVYHAGLTPHRRKQVQNAFMNGKLRIVVATVAFGMGINKNDLRAVIHYNMPASFERFVQEVGRAGRDGEEAHCHLFLESQGRDLSELRRHIYSDSVDRHTVRKLLHRVFKPCKCSNVKALEDWQPESSPPPESHRILVKETPEKNPPQASPVKCPGHEVAFSTDEAIQALDMPEENIQTLLCYLEQWVEVLSPAYTTCKVISYGGPGALKAAAKTCPPLAMAVALDQKSGKSHEKSTSIEFPVIDVAAAIGWESGQVKRQLKELEWKKVNGQNRRTQLVVQLLHPGLRVKAKGSLPPEELDRVLDWLSEKVERQERSKLLQLEALFTALSSVSSETYQECVKEVDEEKCLKLKEAVKNYFNTDTAEFENMQPKLLPGVENEDQVRADVRAMVGTFSDSSFTGRAIARIFHGISSPCFPAQVWGRTRFWRLHLNDNFQTICKIASPEILKAK
ncbi:ATP-dependent DNA helicase Q4 [Neocloeon triangulifer]|uniref:ATP-dependent DNA helicase Q4 n=1 Tax=Neocloeon triangulifer TaxID=2078957 RepID=UPI00286F8919|nr:ATP-dependent DNA helicase Q4 [Neocloeon triangulifer]